MKHDCFVKRREGWSFHCKCLTSRVTESSLRREANLLRQKRGQSTLGGTIPLLEKMEDFSDMGSFSDHPVWLCSVLQERGIFLKEASKVGKCTMENNEALENRGILIALLSPILRVFPEAGYNGSLLSLLLLKCRFRAVWIRAKCCDPKSLCPSCAFPLSPGGGEGERGAGVKRVPKPCLSCAAVPAQLTSGWAGAWDGTSSARGRRLGFLPCVSFADVKHLPSSWDVSYYLCRALCFSEWIYLLPCR